MGQTPCCDVRIRALRANSVLMFYSLREILHDTATCGNWSELLQFSARYRSITHAEVTRWCHTNNSCASTILLIPTLCNPARTLLAFNFDIPSSKPSCIL